MENDQGHDLRVSVTELAGLVSAGSGTLGAIHGQGRLRLGQQAHDRYRAEARKDHPGYAQEVLVRWECTFSGLRVRVEGRADATYPERPQPRIGRSLVVQEIKSILAPDLGEKAGSKEENASQLRLEDLLEELPEALAESYKWQCRLYCHLLALTAEKAGEPLRLRGEVVLVDVRTLEHRRIAVPYDPASCQAFVEARLEALLSQRAEDERMARVRQAFSAEVRFPHPHLRPYQRELMENVAGAAESGLALLVSAPTGIGKTAAALVPLLRGALGTNRRLMVVTAKISQQEVSLDTLEALVPRGEEILVSQLEARERSCPRKEMLCTEHACPLLQRGLLTDAYQAVRRRLQKGGVFRAEMLRQISAAEGLCPHEVGLFAAEHSDVTVCDLNYAFHPQATLDRFFAPAGRERILLIDEAHNLPDRAREFLSPSLSRVRIRELAEGAMQGAHPVFQRILEFLMDVEALISDIELEVDAGPRRGQAVSEVEVDRERTSALQTAAEDWLLDYLAWAKSATRRPTAFVPRPKDGSRRLVDPFIAFLYDLVRFAWAAEERGDHMTPLLRRNATDTELKIFCKDPSSALATRHRRFHAVVAMSATLEPLDFFADELGISRLPRWDRCSFPSPFPPENRCIVVDRSLSTRFRDRVHVLPEACRRMAALAAMRPGNYLAFFPSYALLQTGALLLKAADPTLTVVTQNPAEGAEPVLRAFAAAAGQDHARSPHEAPRPRDRSLVGTVVVGGALSEGVDFVGELAVGAFLFGPALPAVTEERQLIGQYFDTQRGEGFEYAFLYPGLSRVVQAAGRIIRGPTERGIIVLFGERFAEPRYRHRLPAYWQDEIIETDDPLPVVSAFWARQ